MAEKTGKKENLCEEERLALAAKLDAELDEYINNLEKKSYTEGWAEDQWEKEMEKHPFFMKKPPEAGDELSPLMEGLQQLKYGEDENTPEELANNYKEDGNFNYKYKKYRLAILSYTEGIRTRCKDDDLMAQLYNNRAAAHFMLKNYRYMNAIKSSLNDSKHALKLKPNYPKALSRAATCCFHIKDYDQCIDLCDEYLNQSPVDKAILNLKSQAVTARERLKRDKRKRDKLEKQTNKEEEELLDIIKKKGVKLELIDGRRNPELKDLEPRVPQIAQNRVHLDGKDKLVWPVIVVYPEVSQTDFVQNFHEDTLLIDQLEELFSEPPEWDTESRYTLQNINVYFEDRDKCSLCKVNVQHSLGQILRDERFVVRGGTPAFLIFVKDSKEEMKYLSACK